MVRFKIFLLFLLISCGLPNERLNEGKGNKIPKKGYIFKKTDKINHTLFNELIDVNYFYELVELYESDEHFKIINNRIWKPSNNTNLQFYSNSRVRLGCNHPSPEVSGHRGIVYFINDELYSDMFLGVSSGRNTSMHIKTFKIQLKDNKLYFLEKGQLSGNICRVFKKTDLLPTEFLSYNANW